MTRTEFLHILKKIGKFLLATVVVCGVVIYWAIRIYWWLTVTSLILLGMTIGFFMTMNDIFNGNYVHSRRKVSFPKLPGFKMPTELLDKIQEDSPREALEKIKENKDISDKGLYSDEKVQQLLTKLNDLDSHWRSGAHLLDALSEEEMSILLILLLIANGVDIDFED
jgi:hypothetical protein